MDIVLPQYACEILERYYLNGFDAFAVGGCVRDLLLGREPGDCDIAVSALPDDTKRIFDGFHIIDTGIKHGTVTLIYNSIPVEITTFRSDGGYTDSRRPDSVAFTHDIDSDLSRRDFTVNAMAYSPHGGFHAAAGALDDLHGGVIRAVGEPGQRFSEDALRIMRALRFAAVLGFSIEDNTRASLFLNKERLKLIAPERNSAELVKLLCGAGAGDVLREYPQIIGEIIPEILPAVDFPQDGEKHFYDVWGHICRTVELILPEPELRLTMLLHDLGKVQTASRGENGESVFPNHAAVGADIAEGILTRLRFPKKTVSSVTMLIRMHDFKIPSSLSEARLLKGKVGSAVYKKLLLVKTADRGALSPEYRDVRAACERALAYLDEIERGGLCCSVAELCVNGNILASWGCTGRETGAALELLTDAVIFGRCENGREQLREYFESHKNNLTK